MTNDLFDNKIGAAVAMLRTGRLVVETTTIKATDVSDKYFNQPEDKGELLIYHVNVEFDLVTKEPFESYLNKLIEANESVRNTFASIFQENKNQKP